LAHQPKFDDTTRPVFSYDVAQIPDIVLQGKFADGAVLYWVFDAKYRIHNTTATDEKDMAPRDAVDKMNSYHSALLRAHVGQQPLDKSYPVYGAFVLYPGLFTDQTAQNCQQNPHYNNVKNAGVGAFPFLPGPIDSEEPANDNVWVRTFLADIFGNKTSGSTCHHFVEASARIPRTG
jgi:hypothetical protein